MDAKRAENHQKEVVASRALHGDTAGSSALKAMCKKSSAQQDTLNDYVRRYAGEAGKGIDGSEEARLARKDSYATVASRYYDLMTDRFEYVFGESLHFCQVFPKEPLQIGSIKHERYLAQKLQLTAGQSVLDVGCGIGGPAREVAKFSQVKITGLNYSDYQIERGNRYNLEKQLSSQIDLVKGDFMHMPFERDSFDAAYAVEATCYAPSLEAVYSEVFKVLKPGGRFAVYELIMTDAYDENDSDHRVLRDGLERALGITSIATISQAIAAMKAAGFEVQEAEDLACREGTIPWSYQIAGSSALFVNSMRDVSKLLKWRLLRSKASAPIVGMMESLHIMPPGSKELINLTREGVDWVIEAGVKKLFTPIFFMLGRKPINDTGFKQ